MIELTPQQIQLCRLLMYDEASHARLFHRTGEESSEPLFEDWVKLANLFRDAGRVVIEPRARIAV